MNAPVAPVALRAQRCYYTEARHFQHLPKAPRTAARPNSSQSCRTSWGAVELCRGSALVNWETRSKGEITARIYARMTSFQFEASWELLDRGIDLLQKPPLASRAEGDATNYHLWMQGVVPKDRKYMICMIIRVRVD